MMIDDDDRFVVRLMTFVTLNHMYGRMVGQAAAAGRRRRLFLRLAVVHSTF